MFWYLPSLLLFRSKEKEECKSGKGLLHWKSAFKILLSAWTVSRREIWTTQLLEARGWVFDKAYAVTDSHQEIRNQIISVTLERQRSRVHQRVELEYYLLAIPCWFATFLVVSGFAHPRTCKLVFDRAAFMMCTHGGKPDDRYINAPP